MPAGQQHYEFGPFRLDSAGRLLFRDGKRMTLTPKAVEVLVVLVEARGSLVEKEELLQKIWADATVEEGSLTHHVSILRRALGEGHGGLSKCSQPMESTKSLKVIRLREWSL